MQFTSSGLLYPLNFAHDIEDTGSHLARHIIREVQVHDAKLKKAHAIAALKNGMQDSEKTEPNVRLLGVSFRVDTSKRPINSELKRILQHGLHLCMWSAGMMGWVEKVSRIGWVKLL